MDTRASNLTKISQFPVPAEREPVIEVIGGKPMTTSLQVAAFFGKRHDNVLQDIRNIIEAVGEGDALNFQETTYSDSLNRQKPLYLMDKDAFTLLVMGYTGEEAIKFKLAYIRRFNEMEDQLRGSVLAIPNFSDPIAAAEAWIVAERARIAEHARAELAIRTKAQIGNRREATAMNTASQANKKVNALEDELGIGRHYRQVKAIEWLLDVFEPSPAMYQQAGKKLTELSGRMDRPFRVVPDEKYASVKSYHIDVVDAFRALLRTDLNMLSRFRRRLQ